ncbi:MAG: hypothetical protein HY482_01695 [Candidatus Wildermuthbacteria bacterium]|nr:hypothetical protein [Candidatus Wildermuthbacteria bacterium]
MLEQRRKDSVEKVLHDCIKYAETRRIDTPTAFAEYIKARQGEIFKEKSKIESSRAKIKHLEKQKMLAEEALTRFWIKESICRRKKSSVSL